MVRAAVVPAAGLALVMGAAFAATASAAETGKTEKNAQTAPADLRSKAGLPVEGHPKLQWKYAEIIVEWGFNKGTEKLACDGGIEATQTGTVGKAKPLPGDSATTMTGDHAWKSPGSGTSRRGIVVPVLYTPAVCGPARTIITVRTGSGSFSFQPVDLASGPILAPEFGFFVAEAASNTTAQAFQKDLAAKNLKTIRQRVRERAEQTWEGAMRAFHGDKPFPPMPTPTVEPGMSVEVPDPNLTALWRIGAWQIIKNCPRIKRSDVKKLPSIRTWAREIPKVCQVTDSKDPEGIYVVPDHPFIPLACETDRILLALDHMGMHDVAQDGITIWLENQQPDGALFISSYDDTRHSIGALTLLCAIMEHYRLTGDRKWLEREKPRLQKAVQWIIDRRRKTMKENLSPEEAEQLRLGKSWSPYGLQLRMPCGDGEQGRYIFWNDAGGYRSVLMCGDAFADIDPAFGAGLLAEAATYRKDLWKVVDKAIVESPVIRVKDGTCRSFVPQSFADRGAYTRVLPEGTNLFAHCGHFSCDIVVSSASIECWLKSGILSIDDPRIDGHFEVLEDAFLSDNPWLRKRKNDYDPDKDWFGNGGWGYQSGWERIPDFYLMKDDIPNFLRSWLNRCAVDMNLKNWTFNEHTTFAANDKSHGNAVFLSNFRNMVVMEDGNSLWLARATPRAWLEQGKKIAVKNAPTYFGTLAYEIVSDADNGRISATVELPARKAPASVILRLRHPKAAPIRSATVNGKPWKDFDSGKETIRLAGLKGTVTVEAKY